jgi:acyl-CoA synthetase (AMP-forming)/AMP-acid ligase II
VDIDRTLSYRELEDQTRMVANAMIAWGVEIGDKVAIWAPNGWHWIAFALGAHMAGAAIVPLNTRYRGREASHILGSSQPRVLLVAQDFLGNDYLGMLASEGGGAETLAHTVTMGDASSTVRGSVGWDDFLDRPDNPSAVDLRMASLEGSLLSDVMFTSGTTGLPKGVMTTHAQNLRAYYDWSRLAGFGEGERYVIVNPFFHAFGYKAGWLSAFMHGMTVYPHRVLDAGRLLEQVEREKIGVLPGPPALYTTILDHPDLSMRDLSSLRLAVTGAASIPPVLIRRLFSDLGFQRVVTCYGMTEGSAIATITRAEDDLETLASTSGRALPDVDIVVVDDDGSPVEPGQLGEVLVRGYNVMMGYLNASEETAQRIDSEGWLHTGDIGRMDLHGNLAVVDRKGDMFVVGGFNAYPAEIEAVFAEHPAVREVAVIGVPDPRLGEVGAAFVVPTAGNVPDPDDLISWARQRIANFKVPRQVWIVDELPRNATGKVLKGELRQVAGSRGVASASN